MGTVRSTGRGRVGTLNSWRLHTPSSQTGLNGVIVAPTPYSDSRDYVNSTPSLSAARITRGVGCELLLECPRRELCRAYMRIPVLPQPRPGEVLVNWLKGVLLVLIASGLSFNVLEPRHIAHADPERLARPCREAPVTWRKSDIRPHGARTCRGRDCRAHTPWRLSCTECRGWAGPSMLLGQAEERVAGGCT